MDTQTDTEAKTQTDTHTDTQTDRHANVSVSLLGTMWLVISSLR